MVLMVSSSSSSNQSVRVRDHGQSTLLLYAYCLLVFSFLERECSREHEICVIVLHWWAYFMEYVKRGWHCWLECLLHACRWDNLKNRYRSIFFINFFALNLSFLSTGMDTSHNQLFKEISSQRGSSFRGLGHVHLLHLTDCDSLLSPEHR